MPELIKTCYQCKESFLIEEADLAFYQKVSPVFGGKTFLVPPPTRCPLCREQSRLVWRNEHKLYSRKCDLTGKEIISVHASDKDYPVYSGDAWWSDAWDACSYGREFNFTKTFFEQFKTLVEQVPRAALYNVQGENSKYNQSTGNLKNCYLLAGSNYDEDCYYGKYLLSSKNCVDVHMIETCELCYECTDCKNCYNCSFSQDCTNCHDSQFLQACYNCSNCFGCVNLSNKQYCFFNQQYSKEDYQMAVRKFDLGKHSEVRRADSLMREHIKKYPVRYMNGTYNDNVSGDHISQSKNSQYCFGCSQIENCKYCVFFYQAKDCMDVFAWGMPAELCYYSMEVGGGAYQVLFSATCFSSQRLYYCFQCHNSTDCFGCSGLKKKQYCIFNKQYAKDEYEKLVPQIIEHMCSTGEWGEFFPLSFSGFGYNETIAYEQMPSDRVSVRVRGGLWREEVEVANMPRLIPDSIHEIDTTILRESLVCESCQKQYRILSQELAFYKKQSLPVPRHCFSCRHLTRLKKRNPQKLWKSNCSQCGDILQTAVNPTSSRPLYCEACYQKLVY
ncbi:hypothetical protein KA517_01060 [Candidatus Gracilibacteria bacterium]|nr:hypothetical protein [Candidatus Gracilibacteria bacterium]